MRALNYFLSLTFLSLIFSCTSNDDILSEYTNSPSNIETRSSDLVDEGICKIRWELDRYDSVNCYILEKLALNWSLYDGHYSMSCGCDYPAMTHPVSLSVEYDKDGYCTLVMTATCIEGYPIWECTSGVCLTTVLSDGCYDCTVDVCGSLIQIGSGLYTVASYRPNIPLHLLLSKTRLEYCIY